LRVYSRAELSGTIEQIAADGFCTDIASIARDARSHLVPPQDIGTIECAETSRYFRSPKGDKKFLWSRAQTPYLIGPANFGLDDDTCREVIMPKPGRSGGTAIFECYEHKLMKHGPMPDMLIYLGSDSEVDSYCDKGFKYLFEDHPDIKAKIGPDRSDNKIKSKKVDGRSVEVLQANNKTVTGRQAAWMRVDELDTFPAKLCSNFLEQTRIRGRQLGSHRKVGITSHPDMGWASGVAQAWTMSSKGIYIMQCPNCGGHASPYPTKFWPDVPRFKLVYEKMPDGAAWPLSKRLKVAEQTAAMQCPHCLTGLDDKQRFAMVDEAAAGPTNGWMHEGQTLDIEAGIMGEPDENPARGFWIHGLMVKAITNAELARDLEGAVAHYQSTRKVDKLRQVLAKVFAEIFEGAGAGQDLDSAGLQKRARASVADDAADDLVFWVGRCPPGVRFITAAVDPGHGKFDISFRGWDLESRSWWLDRHTIRQRRWADGVMRDIRPTDRIEDWDVLYAVINRRFPIIGRPGWSMPVAAVAIDSGDGNATWKAREFARRSIAKGCFWGTKANPWPKVRLIKGAKPKDAPPLPVVPRKASKDEHGHEVTPIVLEFDLGVHGLKEQSIERLGVADGGPGQCEFADGIAANHFDEYFGETLIEGKFVRNGPNESLDLFGYEEAVRQMLQPDRTDIKWDEGKLPPWATPVPDNVEGGDQAVAGQRKQEPATPPKATKPNILQRFEQLNRGTS
jgi:Bacteriophage tail assembly protein